MVLDEAEPHEMGGTGHGHRTQPLPRRSVPNVGLENPDGAPQVASGHNPQQGPCQFALPLRKVVAQRGDELRRVMFDQETHRILRDSRGNLATTGPGTDE